jgi:hypothetical protein
MRSGGLNRVQRIVITIGLGLGMYVFGGWITTRGGPGSGWVAYAPLSNTLGPSDAIGGLHPWVRLLIWLALIAVWVMASVWLLRSSSDAGNSGPTV